MLLPANDVLARQAIIGIGLRYARAIDQRDMEAFCSCFTSDALWVSSVHEARGHAQMVAVLSSALSHLDATQHLASNFEVVLTGTRATMRSCFIATHVRSPFPHYVMGGVYDDQLILTENGWRISQRKLTIQWTTGDSSIIGSFDSGERSGAFE